MINKQTYHLMVNHPDIKKLLSSTKRKPYETVKRGEYLVGNHSLFFRSKMEANVALYLEWLKNRGDILQWEYEPKTFIFEKILFGTRSYRPDFRITEKNGSIVWYEVKGYFDRKSRTKLKRMSIYFPKEKVVVIDNKAYRELSKWRKLLKWY